MSGTQLVANPEVRTAEDDDGTVLLNARTGTYHALNPVAALIWRGLRRGDDRPTLLQQLRAAYPEVEERRLDADLAELLERLHQLGMVIRADQLSSPGAADLVGPAGGCAGPRPPVPPALLDELHEARGDGGIRPSLLLIGRAWLALVVADLLLRGLGYGRFARFFASRPVAGKVGGDGRHLAGVCAAVDAAARLYVRTAWCLQRSAVTAWLLRRNGLAAELVIGVRQLPFLAHAWVEAGGQVLNDDPQVHSFFDEITRL